jgi:hypothetical protein
MGDEAVATGMIQGGWGYVWAVYAVSWVVITAVIARALRQPPPAAEEQR